VDIQRVQEDVTPTTFPVDLNFSAVRSGWLVSVVVGQSFLELPAYDGIFESSSFVIGKEIPYVCVIFEPSFDLGLFLSFFGDDVATGFDRFSVVLSTVGYDPFLKFNIEREALSYMLLKEIAMFSRKPGVVHHQCVI
jgi:hypothetical protein